MKKPTEKFPIWIFLVLTLLYGEASIQAQQDPVRQLPRSRVKHPTWSNNSVIYEVNIRQYSAEGTFQAFEKDLPRLKELGVDILWIMPVNPIGEKERKGKLGSYYAVKDYKSINPEFGTMDDFIHLVNACHALGLKVILDWVPNHTAFDNNLIKEHPEYYVKDSLGRMVSPLDWSDVLQLDYKKSATRNYMTTTMEWWIERTGIDGFRCDAALFMPTDYWDELRLRLDQIKPVFMLGETDVPSQQVGCFDMSYDWKCDSLMNEIARGKTDASAVMKHINWVKKAYPENAYIMEFTSNHDINAWTGSEYERLGEGALTFAVVSATIPGMPLIYNGQEAALKKRLRFFDKDTIDWSTYPLKQFYQTLITLKKNHEALWNGESGGDITGIETGNEKAVISFYRKKNTDVVVVICNLTGKPQTIRIQGIDFPGVYQNAFTGETVNLNGIINMQLTPWQYLVLIKPETNTLISKE